MTPNDQHPWRRTALALAAPLAAIAGAAILSQPAHAQSTPAQSTPAQSTPAQTAPAQSGGQSLEDPSAILTFQVENDAVSTFKGTSDQYYTSGLRLGWTSPTGAVPTAIAGLGHAVWGDGVQRISIDISQSLFTPRATQLALPNPRDRPYAGELLITGALITDTQSTRSVLGASIGDIGPWAGGHIVQNGFHNAIGDTANLGWNAQLPDQPAFQVLASRSWRLPVASLGGVDADIVPSLAGAVGDVRDYVQAGGIVRIGQGLDEDFGPSRILPGISGTDAYLSRQPFSWYAFAGADGQAVGYDVSLDGSTFRSHSPHVPRIWDVGELEAGLAIQWDGVRITYTQTWQTQEFRGQKSGLFNFGSLAASVKF